MSFILKSCKYGCKVIIDQTNQNHSDLNVHSLLDLAKSEFQRKIKKVISDEYNDMLLCLIIPYIQKHVKLYKRAKTNLVSKTKPQNKATISVDVSSSSKTITSKSSKSFTPIGSISLSNEFKSYDCNFVNAASYETMHENQEISDNHSNSLGRLTYNLKKSRHTRNFIQDNNNIGEFGEHDGGEAGSGMDERKHVLYVDACSLWKFPSWLVDRLDIDQIGTDFSEMSTDKYRSVLMTQIKSTATDLLLYQNVRREFLRTILVIELNNIVKLMGYTYKLDIDNSLKNEFFYRLKPIVAALDDPEKNFIPEMEEMAYVLDELFILIAPAHTMKGSSKYHFNIVYCSMLIPQQAVSFNENCVGGFIDNSWFANESKYFCMVMVTPHVVPRGLNNITCSLPTNKFRIEAYFDVNHGKYNGYILDITRKIDSKYVLSRSIECVLYSYLTKDAHWVEEKNKFLLNGPDIKGNMNFTKIYYSLIKRCCL